MIRRRAQLQDLNLLMLGLYWPVLLCLPQHEVLPDLWRPLCSLQMF